MKIKTKYPQNMQKSFFWMKMGMFYDLTTSNLSMINNTNVYFMLCNVQYQYDICTGIYVQLELDYMYIN